MKQILKIFEFFIGAACLLAVPFMFIASNELFLDRTPGEVSLMILISLLTAFVAGGFLGGWTYKPWMSFGPLGSKPDVTNSWMWFLIALIVNLIVTNTIGML